MPEGDTTGQLQSLIARMRAGDADARRELIDRAVQRLRRLSDKILRQSFPRLRDHGSTVFQEAMLDLYKALDSHQPANVAEFFRLASLKVRQELLDTCRGRKGQPRPPAMPEDDSTLDPARLAQWTEFHRLVEKLPPEQREVFQHVFYAGLTQAETAELLDLHPKAVSRRWIEATEWLLDQLPDFARML